MRSRIILILMALALVASPTHGDDPLRASWRLADVTESLPLVRASVQGKYRNLLRSISCPMDRATYRDFHDYGYYTGTEWQGHKNLPAGHWVWVYPKWYIWGEKVK